MIKIDKITCQYCATEMVEEPDITGDIWFVCPEAPEDYYHPHCMFLYLSDEKRLI